MEGIISKMNSCIPKYPKWLVTRKCCFCVPLRKGVTLFGYAQLVLCFMTIPIIFCMLYLTVTEDEYPISIVLLSVLFLVLESTNTVVLVIGIQTMNKAFLKIYFYVGMVLQVFSLSIEFLYPELRQYPEIVLYYTALALNIYLLFLVYNVIYYTEENAEVEYLANEEPTENIV